MTPEQAQAFRERRLHAVLRTSQPRERTKLAMGDGVLDCEISRTPADLALGLSGREALPRGQGMLFLFPESRPRTRAFWMRGTKIPLDLAFSLKGVITEIHELEPMSEKPVRNLRTADAAIEAGRGWFEERRVRVGDEVNALRPSAQA